MMHNAKTWMAIWVLGTLWWTACNPPHAAEVTALPWSADSLLTTNRTPTWQEAVSMAEGLAASDPRATLHVVGVSDGKAHPRVGPREPSADHDATPDAEGCAAAWKPNEKTASPSS